MERNVVLRLGLAASLLLAGGCAGHFPVDPEHTLDGVTGGTLRVGASVNPPFVEDNGEQVAGSEAELVQDYAMTRDAEITWVRGGEEDLMNRLEHGELDLVIGGLTDKTPWTKKAGLTRPYAESTDRYGSRQNHVLAVPLGENAFLLDLDTYLQGRKEGAR